MNERERQAILFANEAFYTAFTSGNLTAMGELWGEGSGVTCIHPGWAPLTDRAAIMESWAAIMKSPPPVAVQGAVVYAIEAMEAMEGVEVLKAADGPTAAYVLCYEVIGEDTLVATNIYRKLAGGWKLYHHQAGPCPPQQASDFDEDRPALN